MAQQKRDGLIPLKTAFDLAKKSATSTDIAMEKRKETLKEQMEAVSDMINKVRSNGERA